MIKYAVLVKHIFRDLNDIRVDIVNVPIEIENIGPLEVKAFIQSKMLGPFEIIAVTANAEIIRLTKIIAKDLSENDELGSEYTYVNTLKSELEAAKVENLKLEEKLRMAFNCCGGNDDEFKEHTLDCIDWVSRAELQVSHATLSAQLDKAALKEAVDARDYWQQRASRTKIEQFVFENATLTDQLAEKTDQVSYMKDVLQSIGEYWNGDFNEEAMSDMSSYATNYARETLVRINNDK